MKLHSKALISMSVLLVAALFVSGCGRRDHDGHDADAEGTQYVCPMLCVPPTDKPGKCPVCGMELVPAEEKIVDGDVPSLELSDRSKTLIKVQTAKVARKAVSAEVRMVGKVTYDETRLATVAARVSGRIDRLYADFTGMQVNKGDHLAYLYSPDLLSAQEELIQALNQKDARNIEAVREKLRLWGVTTEQVAAIEKSLKPSDHMTIHAPIGGIVVEKQAVEGAYVKTGTPIYTLADLSLLWIELNAYESDLSFIRYGQKVAISAEAHPGSSFSGTISFISPIVDDKTRTVKVRVNTPNSKMLLKPGMFVHATVDAELRADGTAAGTDLSGQWICPMHPEVVKDDSGTCDICEMELIRAEDSRYASVVSTDELPLVVPAAAPLITGKRAVVYIENDKGAYEGREVSLGPRAGDYYVINGGLKEGDTVVVNGAFMIDSALQIIAKPSMMNPPEGSATPEHMAQTQDTERRPQTKCPIMGGDINKEVFADHDGYRVYFCCPGCDGQFKESADELIKKMLAEGIELDRTPTES